MVYIVFNGFNGYSLKYVGFNLLENYQQHGSNFVLYKIQTNSVNVFVLTITNSI